MDIVLVIFGILFLMIGLAGSVIPMLPGPPMSYAALLLLQMTDRVQFTWSELLVWLVLVGIVQLFDFVVPMLGTKYTGGSTMGKRGCIAGTILGMFFMPWGIVVGPFLGAVVGELMIGRTSSQALMSGLGSLLGFLFGTVVKIVLCLYFIWVFVAALLS